MNLDIYPGVMKLFLSKMALLTILLTAVSTGVVEAGKSDARVDSYKDSFVRAETSAKTFDGSATLDKYLSWAGLHSPQLKAAFYRWEAAIKKIAIQKALPDPTISYMQFIENVETRVGPQEFKLSVRQSIPWFGTLGAKKDIASSEERAAWSKFQSEKVKLFYQVKNGYFRYYLLGREISLMRDNLELLTFWESVLLTKYKVGLKGHSDLIRAQVELGKLEDRLISLEESKRPVAARLKALLNLPDTIDLSLPTNSPPVPPDLPRDTVLAAVYAHNPDLDALQNLIAREDHAVRLASKQSRPSFTLGVDYIGTGDALNSSMLDSGKDPWTVMVGIKLPIWLGKNRAVRQKAEATRLAAGYRFEAARNNLTAQTEQIFYEYNDARRKITLYRNGLVPKAEQSIEASFTAYQAGKLDFLNLLDAQRQWLNFQLQLDRSVTQAAIKLAQIEMVSGRVFGNNYQSNNLNKGDQK